MRLAPTVLAGLFLLQSPSSAHQADLRSIFAAPIAIERTTPVTSVPLALKMGKLFVNAVANGQSREFIFDTGSPTILSRTFADALGLKIVGQNTGVDANGAHVTMDVAVLESLSIGGTAFHSVPVLIFDFTGLDMGACIIDGGILGSEILPGSAWRIDTQSQRLSIAATAAALGGEASTVRASLHDFGYPHPPIADYAVGDVKDKALFDTGNAEQVTLFRKVAESPSVRKGFVPGSLFEGHGYEGESAGGRGDIRELSRFSLSDFRIDNQSIGPVRATTRSVPPSLVGAGMLASHIVTLDYPGKYLLLEKRRDPVAPRTEAGYALAAIGDHVRVVQLFEKSPAARAGLKLGDDVVAANGRSLVVSPDGPECSISNWLADSFKPEKGANIVVLRDGKRLTIRIPSAQATMGAARQ